MLFAPQVEYNSLLYCVESTRTHTQVAAPYGAHLGLVLDSHAWPVLYTVNVVQTFPEYICTL